MKAKKSILLIAGEISGDMHAAHLVGEMKARYGALHFFGVGGDELRAEGMEILYDVKDMAVMGFGEVIQRYGFFKRTFKSLLRQLEERKPDAVVLVDYAEFNLRFAAEAHKRGVPVIYYICPQVWAWRKHRIKKIARCVDKLIAIFPFEVEVFAGTGLNVEFAGHPLVDEVKFALSEPEIALPWGSGARIALLPGSRKQELARIFPTMLQAAGYLERQHKDLSFIAAAPSAAMARELEVLCTTVNDGPKNCQVVVGQTRQVLRQARAAFVTSGTATVETALMGTPMVVVYKTAWLTYWMARMLIRISHIGMVNIIAKRTVCPELIQEDATSVALAAAVEPLLGDTQERREMLNGLGEVREALGEGRAAERASEAVGSTLGLR